MRRLMLILSLVWIAALSGCTLASSPAPTATFAPISNPPLPANLTPATVIRIIDGDTIDVRIGGDVARLRLIGIDTPESGRCFYAEAGTRLATLLKDAQVLLEADPSQDDRDRYGRLLRFVWLPDGTLVNLVLVREGYAFEYMYRVPSRYTALLVQAGADAEREQVGLWSAATCNGQAGRRR